MDVYMKLPSDIQKIIDRMIHEMKFRSTLDKFVLPPLICDCCHELVEKTTFCYPVIHTLTRLQHMQEGGGACDNCIEMMKISILEHMHKVYMTGDLRPDYYNRYIECPNMLVSIPDRRLYHDENWRVSSFKFIFHLKITYRSLILNARTRTSQIKKELDHAAEFEMREIERRKSGLIIEKMEIYKKETIRMSKLAPQIETSWSDWMSPSIIDAVFAS